MRISDWSSDVCSSDLAEEFALAGRHARSLPAGGGARMVALVDMGKAMQEYFAARVGPAAQAAGELRIACQQPLPMKIGNHKESVASRTQDRFNDRNEPNTTLRQSEARSGGKERGRMVRTWWAADH